jgi:hypothetical protein
MKEIIEELQKKREYELRQIGLTPISDFKGTQKEHDEIHQKNADEYEIAINILSSKFKIRDWITGELTCFEDYMKAKNTYQDNIDFCLKSNGEIDCELFISLDTFTFLKK